MKTKKKMTVAKFKLAFTRSRNSGPPRAFQGPGADWLKIHFRAFHAVKMSKFFNYEAPEAQGQTAPPAPLSAALSERFETVENLTVKSSLQGFDAKEMYLHPKNRSVSLQKRRKIFCFHHFPWLTLCRFQIMPLEFRFQNLPFSKSASKNCGICV